MLFICQVQNVDTTLLSLRLVLHCKGDISHAKACNPPVEGRERDGSEAWGYCWVWLLVGSVAPQEPNQQGISWLNLLMLSKANVYSREEATHWVILQALLVFSVSLKESTTARQNCSWSWLWDQNIQHGSIHPQLSGDPVQFPLLSH